MRGDARPLQFIFSCNSPLTLKRDLISHASKQPEDAPALLSGRKPLVLLQVALCRRVQPHASDDHYLQASSMWPA
jgi:hypothetical protein